MAVVGSAEVKHSSSASGVAVVGSAEVKHSSSASGDICRMY